MQGAGRAAAKGAGVERAAGQTMVVEKAGQGGCGAVCIAHVRSDIAVLRADMVSRRRRVRPPCVCACVRTCVRVFVCVCVCVCVRRRTDSLFVADLGLAVALGGGPLGAAQLSQIRGTPNFVAPEGWQVGSGLYTTYY